jgi:hypothetical protein
VKSITGYVSEKRKMKVWEQKALRRPPCDACLPLGFANTLGANSIQLTSQLQQAAYCELLFYLNLLLIH